jgi:hypothetical protein
VRWSIEHGRAVRSAGDAKRHDPGRHRHGADGHAVSDGPSGVADPLGLDDSRGAERDRDSARVRGAIAIRDS